MFLRYTKQQLSNADHVRVRVMLHIGGALVPTFQKDVDTIVARYFIA